MKKFVVAILLLFLTLISLEGRSEERALSPSEYLRKATDALKAASRTGEDWAWRKAAENLRLAKENSKPGDDYHEVASSALRKTLALSPFLGDAEELADLVKNSPKQESQIDDREITCMSYSQDGKRLVVGYTNGTVEMFNAETLKKIADLEGFWENVMNLCFSPDCKSVIPVARGYSAYRFSLEDGSLLQTYDLKYHLSSAAFSSNGKYLLLASASRYYKAEFKVFDAKTHELISTHEDENAAQAALFSSNNKSYLIFGVSSQYEKSWFDACGTSLCSYDVKTGEKQEQLFLDMCHWRDDNIPCVYLRNDDGFLISHDYGAYLVETEAKENQEAEKVKYEFRCLWDAYDAKSNLLWMLGENSVEKLNTETKKIESSEARGHKITTGAFSSGLQKLIYGNEGGEVRLADGNSLLWRSKDKAKVQRLAFATNGSSFVVKAEGLGLVRVPLSYLSIFEYLAENGKGIEQGVIGLTKMLTSIRSLKVPTTAEEKQNAKKLLLGYLKEAIVQESPVHTAFAIEKIQYRHEYFGGDQKAVSEILKRLRNRTRLASDDEYPLIFLTIGEQKKTIFAAFESGEICIWRLSDGNMLLHEKLEIKDNIVEKAVGGRFVLVATKDNKIVHYNVNLALNLGTTNIDKPIKSLHYANWGFRGVAFCEDNSTHIFEWHKGFTHSYTSEKKIVEILKAKDEQVFAARYEDGSIGLWSIREKSEGLIKNLEVDEEILDMQFINKDKTTRLYLLLPKGKMKIYNIADEAITETKDKHLPFTPTGFGPSEDQSNLSYYLKGDELVPTLGAVAKESTSLRAPCPFRGMIYQNATAFVADKNGNLTIWKKKRTEWSQHIEHFSQSPVTQISSFAFKLWQEEPRRRFDRRNQEVDELGVVVGYENGSISFID